MASPVSPNEQRPDYLVVLGIMPPCTEEDVKQAYLAKVKTAHPDVGGSVERFREVHDAYEKALEYARFRKSRMAWLGTWVEKYAEQQEAIAILRSRGAEVVVEEVDWLKRSFGEDFANVVEKLVGLKCEGPGFGDELFTTLEEHFESFKQMRDLSLAGSRVTDQGIQRLALYESLRRLDLRRTRITADALRVVDRLPQLEWIGLSGTRVSWWAAKRLGWHRPQLTIA